MSRIVVTRTKRSDSCTMGYLTVNGIYVCATLEDVERTLGVDGAGKVYGETAIPAGEYRVVLSFSPHFGMTLPEILTVPSFSNIRIHAGNVPADTFGCILVGDEADSPCRLQDARMALGRLLPKLTGEDSILVA